MASQLRLKRIQEASDFNILYTPQYATEIIAPHIAKKFDCIWECACGKGHIADVLKEYNVVSYQSDIRDVSEHNSEAHIIDFLNQDELPDNNIEAIVTNPPYSIKDKFIKKCFEFDIPFALLMPLSALGGKARVNMYMEHGIEILVPDVRVNFIYDKDKKSNWFHTAWFCHNILPEKLMFTTMKRD